MPFIPPTATMTPCGMLGSATTAPADRQQAQGDGTPRDSAAQRVPLALTIEDDNQGVNPAQHASSVPWVYPFSCVSHVFSVTPHAGSHWREESSCSCAAPRCGGTSHHRRLAIASSAPSFTGMELGRAARELPGVRGAGTPRRSGEVLSLHARHCAIVERS